MRFIVMLMLCCFAMGYSQEVPEENPSVAAQEDAGGSDSFINWACNCGKNKGGKPKR